MVHICKNVLIYNSLNFQVKIILVKLTGKKKIYSIEHIIIHQ